MTGNSSKKEKDEPSAGVPVISEIDGRLCISGKLIHVANSGVLEAQVMLAKIHRCSNPQLRDIDKAVRWLRAAGEQGHLESLIELGMMYQLGEDVTADPEEAARMYCDAGIHGSAEGLFRLAMMFYLGKGIPKDLLSAYAWFSMAAARGHRDAGRQLKNLRKLLTSEEREEADELYVKIQGLMIDA